MLFSIVKLGVAALALFPDGGFAMTRKHVRGGRRELSSFPEVNRIPPELYGPGDNFYEAESLDYFKNEISPSWFEWLNPDEVEAGGTTCGFLYPDLGLLHDVTYPTIQVYVCVRFANVQPAVKGNMFVHCGGPGSLSSCTNIMIYSGYLSEKNLDEYNIWSIDQRGMGRSWPNFAHDECSLNKVIRDSTGAIQNMVDRDEEVAWVNVFLDDEDQIKLNLQKYKSRASDCWGVLEFNMNAIQSDGSVREFHFLEHSGTRSLAQDVHLLRHLMNAPKLHLYGISYGTSVFSTYATLFPSYVGLFVLDSNVSPNPDHYHIAFSKSVGLNNRINYVLYSCSAHNARSPGWCPVEDLRKCVSDINAMLSDRGVNVGGGDGFRYIQIALWVLFRYRDRAEEVCALADAEDRLGFAEIMDELYFSMPTEEKTETAAPVAISKQGVDPRYSQPTSTYSDVYDNPDYLLLVGRGKQIPIALVRGQDRAGAVYDEDFFAKEVLAFGKKYTGAGTGRPAMSFFAEYSIGFYWPKSAPIPPAGSPFLNGIIVGLLYDSKTPYVWAQEMRAAFPYTSMLTSQATNHGLGGDDRECQSHVTDYLDSGYINFVDGLVCGDDFASGDDFLDIFFPGSSSTKRQTLAPSPFTTPPTESSATTVPNTNEPTTQPTMAPRESKTSVPTSYVVSADGDESAAPGESKTSVPTSAATLVPSNGNSNIFSHGDGLVTDDGDQNKPAGNNQTANATTPTNAAITSAPTPSIIAPTNGPTTVDATMIKSGCSFRHHSCYHWLFHLGVTLVPLIFFFQ